MDALEFDFVDRMRKALRISDLGVQQIADEMELSRNTLGAWLAGRSHPKRRDLRMYARITGVPLEWIETGAVSESRESIAA